MIGKILSNRYKLISERGSGGMAWVYLAEDLREEKRVAVKILYPQLSQDVGFVQRFTQEAKLAISLSESAPQMHVASILDYGSDRDTHYLVMEYVEGHDLRQLLEEEGRLPWRQAMEIAKQVALALGHAHQHGIVHRDIKPGNIMLLPDGTVRVLDFGVARARNSPTLTHSGFVGSPFYAAPEQAMGHSVDIRADLYSLGIVLFEMLSGELPFASDTPWVIINHHIATPPPLLEEVRPEVPGAVSRLVRKAMSKRPEDRFQTPAGMVQSIEVVLSGLDLPHEAQAVDPEVMVPLLAGLYQRAMQAIEDQDWSEAVDMFSQVLRLDPRYRDVTERLAEAGWQARLAALYSAATDALKAGHWAEALGQLDEITDIAPDYRDVKELRDSTQQKLELDQLYRKGVEHMEAQEWAAAIKCLEQVRALDTHYLQAPEFLDTARAEQAALEEQNAPPVESKPLMHQTAPSRRRRVLWGVAALLILALAAGSFLFLQAQKSPTAAALSAEPTATSNPAPPGSTPFSPPTIQATDDRSRPTTTLSEAHTSTPLPPTPNPIDSPAASSATEAAQPTSASAAAAINPLTPTSTLTVTLTSTPMPEPALAGQIAFPRFDPLRGTYDVYVCRVDGSNCRRVATEASQPDFLPGGDQLVVHSWRGDDKGLILQTLSGERVWKISDGLEAARPSVDFQGKRYVFHSREEVDRQPRLHRTYDAETRSIRQGGGAMLGQSPSWLPNGQILYSGCWQDTCGIIAMHDDGTDPQQVVAGSSETNPEAAPDGRRVAFMSRRDGNWEIYVAKIDGSGLKRLTNDPANDGLPAWSPDGRHIAFVSDRDGSWAVWAIRPGGSDLRRLFSLGGSPDGRVLEAPAHETYGWVEERISWGPLP